MLNKHIPLDAIIRWWYVFVTFSGIGLVFSLATNPDFFPPIEKAYTIMEGSPPIKKTATRLVMHSDWNYDLLFLVLGLLVACGVAWLLEELRDYRQRKGEP